MPEMHAVQTTIRMRWLLSFDFVAFSGLFCRHMESFGLEPGLQSGMTPVAWQLFLWPFWPLQNLAGSTEESPADC